VNSYTTSAQYAPAVAADGAGNFMVTWQSLGSAGSDASSYSVQADVSPEFEGTPKLE